MNNTGSEFGATLRSLRVHAQVKQVDLAERLGLHRNTIGAWERGDYLPDLTTVHQIANLLCLNEQDTNRLFSAHSAKTPLAPPWNIPFLRNVFFTGREEVLQQLHDGLQKNKDTTSILTRSYVLCGLGGIGKTQIAIEYAYRFHHEYRSVFWIQADSHETIIASYLAIADILDMPEKNEQDQHRIVKAVIRWLNTHTYWLLIYDNVEDFASVQHMFPTTHLGSILLTTRSQATGSIALTIEIAELSPEEAVSFLLRRAKVLSYDEPLHQVDPADHAAASAIAESLGRLPLALDQAGAYIEEHRCSFSDYLTLYQKHRTVLLYERGNLGTDHPHSVVVTFALTFAQVQQRNPAAADLLRLSAFLAPDAIPQELLTDGAAYLGPLLQPVATDPLLLDRAFKDLLLSSLIRRSCAHTNIFSIHRLVQVVLRDGMDQEEQHTWVERAIRAMNQVFPENEMNRALRGLCTRLLPHALCCINLCQQWHCTFLALASLLLKVADYLQEAAQYSQAEPLYQQALLIYEQLGGSTHPDTTICLTHLASLYYNQGRYGQAEPLCQKALAIYEHISSPSQLGMASCLTTLALLHREQSRYTEAEPLYLRALAIYEQELGSSHPDLAICLTNLALLYWYQGKFAEAEPLYLRALAIYEQELSSSHPDTAICLTNLAMLYRDLGRYEEAESLGQRAVTIHEQMFGSTHPIIAISLTTLASVYNYQGKYEKAEPLCQRALAIREEVLGPSNAFIVSNLIVLGRLYRDQGRYGEAELLGLRALTICEQVFDPFHFLTAIVLTSLARIYWYQGQHQKAKSLCQRALEIRKQVLGLTHPDTVMNLAMLARLHEEPVSDSHAQS